MTVPCTMHNTIEERLDGSKVSPYRCSRCGGCFLCQHKLVKYTHWICGDGFKKKATQDSGVAVK